MSRSHVDADRQTDYKEKSQPLSDYENRLTRMANIYYAAPKENAKAAACVLLWLDKWARNRALLGNVNASGESVRKWGLAAMASAYAQVMREPSLDPVRKSRVEGWIRDVAYQVVADYSRKIDLKSRQNNHLYWAAWGVAMASYALQDTTLFQWAMTQARFGIGQIRTDGSLPLEMSRGGRALLYHVFAATPLVMLAEMGRRNGVDLYAENDGAVHRLIALALSGLDDPSWFESETGKAQDYKDINDGNGLAWVPVYGYRFSSPLVTHTLKHTRGEPINRRLGGNTKILFPE